ncbi:thioredoxin [Escherichia phage moha]|uniref:Thioredoxin n=1 Tax=Escherichia phage moha TaxID=2696423 RepID=A0A6B9WW03_9CAUD|nr:thioredoxin [Escherichia phage moha]
MSITSDAVKHEIAGLCASQIKVWFDGHNDRRSLNYEQIAIQVHQLLVSKFDFHMPSEIYTNLPRAIIKACKGYGKSMADGIFNALNKLNVLSMINSNNILRNLGRTDLFGREQGKMPLKQIIAHLNQNQTRFLAVAARLQTGLDRQMNFKTHPRYSGSSEFFNCELQKVAGKTVLVVRVTFEGRRQGYFDLIGSGLKHCGFIDEVDIKRDGIGYRIGYVCTLKEEEISEPVPPKVKAPKEVTYDINRDDALQGLIDELNEEVIPVQKFESKHAEQIKYFEALINELNVTIQQTDDEISRLAGMNGKNKTERANLIQVVKLLKD